MVGVTKLHIELLRIYLSETGVFKSIQILLVGLIAALLLTSCGEKAQQTPVAQPSPLPAPLPPASAEAANVNVVPPTRIFTKDFADIAINKNEYQNKEITFNCPMVLEAMGSFFCVPKDGGGLKVELDEKTINPETNAILIKNCTKMGNKCHGYVEGTLNIKDRRLIIQDAKIPQDTSFYF